MNLKAADEGEPRSKPPNVPSPGPTLVPQSKVDRPPLERGSFPHPPRGNSPIPATIENVEYLLAGGGFVAQFNVIKKRIELRRDDGSPASMSQVVSLAMQHGIGTGWLYQFVDEIARRTHLNPVREWIRSVPWDGRDRLAVTYATIEVADDYPPGLKEKLLKRWLLSAAVAALADTRFRARGVLTLQGDQGIGKTSWIRALLPPGPLREDCIKLDHHMDGGNKDSMIAAITHWIVEIGELDSSFKKDVARLKGFLTNDCDKLRRPYAREESEYPRRTVFAATVNDETFLVDPTGNSRFWTIAATRLYFDHRIDMQQLFAQLASMFEAGEQWWLTPDEERTLASYNLRHRSISAIGEKVRDHVAPLVESGRGTNMTATELLEQLGIKNPTNPQTKEAGAMLRELLGTPKRINGRYKWRIPAPESKYPGLATDPGDDNEIY